MNLSSKSEVTVFFADINVESRDYKEMRDRVFKTRPCLFGICVENTVTANQEILPRFIIDIHNSNSVRYADDTVLVAERQRKLQELPEKVLKEK